MSTPITPSQNNNDSPENTLSHAFANTKFVFTTASKRRAVVYKRSIINQWFDNWTLGTDTLPSETEKEKQKREYLPAEGLRESSAYIHQLLRKEISLVGGNARNVFLSGLSQGCAAAFVALLLWDGGSLGAGVGMCGWLPFQKQMEDIACGRADIGKDDDDEVEGEESGNPFKDSSDSQDDGDGSTSSSPPPPPPPPPPPLSPPVRAVQYLREELEISSSASWSPSLGELPYQKVPLFPGHGEEDEKVPISFGRDAASCMRAMGMEVTWNEYHGLGHWYSENMLSDLVDFVRKREPR